MLRYTVFALVILLTVVSAGLIAWNEAFVIGVLAFGGLTALGVWDLIQPHHAILRNYPVLGHMRFIFEGIRPEIRQYLIESDKTRSRSAANSARSSTSAPRASRTSGRSAPAGRLRGRLRLAHPFDRAQAARRQRFPRHDRRRANAASPTTPRSTTSRR